MALHDGCRACGTFVEPPDVGALQAELAALRERAERAEKLIEGMKAGILLNARVAAHERVTLERIRAEGLRARDARVALLEGLLRKTLSAFSEGEQWWRVHSGRCSETCPDNHRCCALYAEVLAALADGG